MAKESIYTDEVVAIMVEAAPLDWAKAQVLGEQFGVSPRSIVASAKRRGIEYKRQEKVSKTGAKIVSKAELIGMIADKFEVDEIALDGLDKATKSALEALLS